MKIVQNTQKESRKFVNFVHTYGGEGDILLFVKPPNILYIVFTTPHRDTFSEKTVAPSTVFFRLNSKRKTVENGKGA